MLGESKPISDKFMDMTSEKKQLPLFVLDEKDPGNEVQTSLEGLRPSRLLEATLFM